MGTTAMVDGLTPLATGFCFGEGPRWFEGLLWFSDMLGEAVHTAHRGRRDDHSSPVPGHAPSGLGFRPDGSLLIASTERRERCCAYDGENGGVPSPICVHVAPADLGDMVIDNHGPCLHRVAGFSRAVSSSASTRITAS